jgi:hypothetical protein
MFFGVGKVRFELGYRHLRLIKVVPEYLMHHVCTVLGTTVGTVADNCFGPVTLQGELQMDLRFLCYRRPKKASYVIILFAFT